jgi:hypothetical protein
LVLIRIMSSCWALFTSLIDKVPILRLNTTNATTFKLIWSLFWTNTSVLIITEYMRVLTLHTLSCLCNPKVWRITLNANIIRCQIRSFNWAFTFSFLDVINKCLRACFAF